MLEGALAIIFVLAALLTGGIVSCWLVTGSSTRLTTHRRPVTNPPSISVSEPGTGPWRAREVVPVVVDTGHGSVEIVVVGTTGTKDAWRLVGGCPSVGTMAAFEGWCTTSMPVLLCIEPLGRASLHGPTASIVNLRAATEAPDSASSRPATRSAVDAEYPSCVDPVATSPMNVLEFGGHRFLRVTTRFANGLHLSGRVDLAGSDPGRPAIDRRRARFGLDGCGCYDIGAMLRPAWTNRTLCGLPWLEMADHDADLSASSAVPDRYVAFDGLCLVCVDVAMEEGESGPPRY